MGSSLSFISLSLWYSLFLSRLFPLKSQNRSAASSVADLLKTSRAAVFLCRGAAAPGVSLSVVGAPVRGASSHPTAAALSSGVFRFGKN